MPEREKDPSAGISPSSRRTAVVLICLMVAAGVAGALAAMLRSGRWVHAIVPLGYVVASLLATLVQYHRRRNVDARRGSSVPGAVEAQI